MGKYRISIALISDLCVSDGGVYNSSLDTDVCYDAYGFPFIPAKRLKGCLRECGLELQDWGKEVDVKKLFGEKGDQRGVVRISNAVIDGYEELKDEIEDNPDSVVYHPQHILQRYTYIRTQTAVNYDLGVADENSLRTMRVVKRGNVFYAEAECPDDMIQEVKNCCRVLRYMGIARTRGLGEVRCTVEPWKAAHSTDKKRKAGEFVPGANKLWYEIRLKEPVIMKSIQGGEAKTLDYIEGSTMIGVLSNYLRKNGGNVTNLLDKGEIQFSNAYISADGNRFLEVPGNYYSIKNEDWHFVDKLYADGQEQVTASKQLGGMKHSYLGYNGKGVFEARGVEVETRYHHRRPEDKSIGRAKEEASGDSTLFQMSSIMAGQTFQGFVYGKEEQIAEIYRLLAQVMEAEIGYSRTAEYGKVEIGCVKTEKTADRQIEGIDHFCVKLEAPTVIYGDTAMYSVSPEDLKREIAAELEIPWGEIDTEATSVYLKYTDVGGYNVTWGARKPLVTAFDKGTVVDFVLKNARTIRVPSQLMIGERVLEGYGEASLIPHDKDGGYLIEWQKESGETEQKILDVSGRKLAYPICRDLFGSYIKLYAVKMTEDFSLTEALKPTVSNMLLMCNECDTIDRLEEMVQSRYNRNSEKKKQKADDAQRILRKVKEKSEDCVKDFSIRYGITGFALEEQKKVQFRLLEAFLVSIKYAFRDRRDQNE